VVKQHELAPAPGSRHASKRVGRGTGSGHGTFSGRGCKGQKARTGNNKVRPGFEGGQLPLIKRLPRKRGFINRFRIEYTTVNTGDLNKLESGSEVTAEILKKAGIPAQLIPKISEGKRPNIIDMINTGQLALLINTPTRKGKATDEGKIRAAAVTHEVPIVTTLTGARAVALAIGALQKKGWSVKPIQDYHLGSKKFNI